MTDLHSNEPTLAWNTNQATDPIQDLQSAMHEHSVQPTIIWMSATTAQFLADAGERLLAEAIAVKDRAAQRLVCARLNVARASRRNRARAKREVINAVRAFIGCLQRCRSARDMQFFMPPSADSLGRSTGVEPPSESQAGSESRSTA
jgi:hypothetical protein